MNKAGSSASKTTPHRQQTTQCRFSGKVIGIERTTIAGRVDLSGYRIVSVAIQRGAYVVRAAQSTAPQHKSDARPSNKSHQTLLALYSSSARLSRTHHSIPPCASIVSLSSTAKRHLQSPRQHASPSYPRTPPRNLLTREFSRPRILPPNLLSLARRQRAPLPALCPPTKPLQHALLRQTPPGLHHEAAYCPERARRHRR